MHCGRYRNAPMNRRESLAALSQGFGAVALSALWAETAISSQEKKPLHHLAKAKNIIFLYMDGGPSQVDTFDPKPVLEKYDGQDPNRVFKVEPTQFNNVGKIFKSPWKFSRHGQSGLPISELFPHLTKHADELTVVRSAVSNFSEHTNANYFLHTGNGFQGRPSWGAWASYGLGSFNKNLPGFIVLNGGLIPPGGLDNFNSGFLPAAFQGSVFKSGAVPLANIDRKEATAKRQEDKLKLVRQLDAQFQDSLPGSKGIEAAIANQETAFLMQTAIPELMEIQGESKATLENFGIHSANGPTRIYGTQCLVARRLIERGARFIEITCPSVGTDRWDQHGDLKAGHEKNALAVDQPVAALLQDLKTRGLLQDTLIVWTGEFGRTPFAQGANGRDHNPFGFSFWMAGGGVRGGITYGKTDDFGYHVVENKVEIHDLHATMLHLLGIDHKKLTFRFGGRDMRLTDVHGEVLNKILA